MDAGLGFADARENPLGQILLHRREDRAGLDLVDNFEVHARCRAGGLVHNPFDGDFDKLADPVRFRRALDSLYLARQSGRRVWLISDARWIRPYVSAPDELSRDSLGGLGQADRARANRFYRYLRWLYGPPVLTYATTTTGPGPEHAAAWLFAHPETGSDPAP